MSKIFSLDSSDVKNEIRLYEGNTLTFYAPDGYNITKVVFTGGTIAYNGSNLNNKTWEGEAASVVFTGTSGAVVNTATVTLARALPFVVSFGDLNDNELVVGDIDAFSTTVTPADNSLVEDTDYEIEWSSSNNSGLNVLKDGTYEAVSRGAYKVTVTTTALDNETYRDATKEYDVTVTAPVVVLAEDVVMALGDDPKAITVVKSDGYAGTLTYQSNNTAVATVDAEGKVTAVAKGSTTITISAPADATNYFTAGENVVINVSVKGQAELAYATTLYNVAYGAEFPTPALTNPHNLPITYAKSGDNVATVDASTGAVTILTGTKGTARITASTVGNDEYAPGSAYYDIKVYDPDGNDGSESKPFEVDEALEFIEDLGQGNNTGDVVYYVHGIVSYAGSVNSDNTQTFKISVDGTENDELRIYEGKYLNDADFTNVNKLKVGDEVIVVGQLEYYYYDETDFSMDMNNGYLTSFYRAPKTLPYSETFANTFGDFIFDGTQANSQDVWKTSSTYAKASSYISNSNYNAESWLISPLIDAQNVAAVQLSFEQAINKYFGTIENEAMVYAKKESDDNWSKLSISEYPSAPSSGYSPFLKTTIDLTSYARSKFQIAFVYRGTTTTAGTWEVKNVIISPSAVDVKIPESGYLTYCSPYALDFSETVVEAYTAAYDNDEGKVILTEVEDGIVPANVGVVVYSSSEAGNYPVPVTDTEKTTLSGNEMVGVTELTPVPWTSDGKYNYILQQGKFKKATGASLTANRAYLHTSFDVTQTGGAPELDLAFGDETTSIQNIERTINDNQYYTLDGRRVETPSKGIYIINGKKVVVK